MYPGTILYSYHKPYGVPLVPCTRTSRVRGPTLSQRPPARGPARVAAVRAQGPAREPAAHPPPAQPRQARLIVRIYLLRYVGDRRLFHWF